MGNSEAVNIIKIARESRDNEFEEIFVCEVAAGATQLTVCRITISREDESSLALTDVDFSKDHLGVRGYIQTRHPYLIDSQARQGTAGELSPAYREKILDYVQKFGNEPTVSMPE